MTPEQREQKAREFLASIPGVHDSGGMGSSHDEYVRELVDILAKTERATLEEVAKEIASTRDKVSGSTFPLSSVLADIIRWLNGLIKERS